jgi:two-component system LytT family sensor kinase
MGGWSKASPPPLSKWLPDAARLRATDFPMRQGSPFSALRVSLLPMSDEFPSWAAERPNWVRVWIGLLGLWATFIVLGTCFNYQSLLARGRPISWTQAIRMNVVAYGIWAFLLTPLVLSLCARFPLGRRGLFKLVPAHFLSIAATVCIDVCIKTLLGGRVFPGAQSHPFVTQFRRYVFAEAEADIQIYLLIGVIGYVVAYYGALRAQETHAAELETNLVRAELQVLKIQLQPHFLFNTLHSVAALVRKDPGAAEKMICSLGDLLRLTLVAEETPKVTLRRELGFLQTYLDIQRARFQDRLITEINVAEDDLDATVPYLLLQPLVENAIKHGVARSRGLSKIEIRICKESDDLKISVVNDNSASNPVSEQDRLGVGLENVKNRLRILYGRLGQLSVSEFSDGQFEVEVRIPFETESRPRPELPLASCGLPSGLEIGR